MTLKRAKAAIARSTASLLRLPVEATDRPRPQRTFSLKTGVGARTAPSYTTRRTEFEPMSMTPIGSISAVRSLAPETSFHRVKRAPQL